MTQPKIADKYKNISESKARQLFQDLFRSARNKYTLVSSCRDWLPSSLYNYAIGIIYKQSPKVVFLPSKLTSIKQISAWSPLTKVTYKKELEWCLSLIQFHSKELQKFIDIKSLIEDSILTDNLDSAEFLLDQIENELGPSNWWIKNKIGLLQRSKGLESQKQFTNEVKSNFSSRSIQSFVIHQISICNEPTVTPSKLIEQLNKEINSWKLDDEHKESAIYHISGRLADSINSATNILRQSTSESIIDVYEATIFFLKNILIHCFNDKDLQLGKKSVDILMTILTDKRIENLSTSFLVKCYEKKFSNEEVPNSRKAETRNYLSEIIKNSLLHQEKNLPTGLLSNLSILVHSIISKGNNMENDSTELERIALAFPTFETFEGLNAVSCLELNNDYRFHPNDLNDQQNKDFIKTNQQATFFLSSCKININKHNICECNYLDYIHDEVFFQNTYIKTIISCQDYLRKKNFKSCLVIATELWRTSNQKIFQTIGFKYTLMSLIGLGDIKNIVSIFTEEYVMNNNVRYLLPIKDITDMINKDIRKSLSNTLSIPIMFDVYSRHVDGSYLSTLRRSVSDLLLNFSVAKPSLLLSNKNTFNSDTFVYFLRYCCIPENYYTTGGFDSSHSLIEERLVVLENLVILDPQNEEIYSAEIYERTRRMVLDARRAEVEHSKIELNADGFLKVAEKKVKESYDRFMTYSTLDLTKQVYEASIGVESPTLVNAIPEKEDSSLFNNIIKDLLEIFLHDRFYGLDGVIGTRIRHNVLESELRSPLVASNLITSKNSLGIYNFNTFWLSDLALSKIELALDLNDIFSEFSDNYDSLLLSIKNEWVQIKGPLHESGLIDVSYEHFKVDIIEDVTKQSNVSFINFCEEIFTIFSNALEQSLIPLIEKLETVGKSKSLELIDILEQKLKFKHNISEELNDELMNTRASIIRAYDRVKEWFRLSFENSTDPIKFEDVIQICIEIIQRYQPSFVADIDLDDTAETLVPGILIRAFSDMFIILFDNAIKRSGMFPLPKVYVKAKFVENFIRVTIENEISKDINLELEKIKLDNILINIENKTYKEKIKGDSGTGIYRLYESIINGIRIDPNVSISVSDGRIFKISFNLISKHQL